MNKLLFAATALALALPVPALADANSDFDSIADQVWQWQLKESPLLASYVGVHDYDDRLDDISLAADDRRVAQSKAFIVRLDALPTAQLDAGHKADFGILHRVLAEGVEASSFGQRAINFTNRDGWHQFMATLADLIAFRNRTDYANYIKRLRLYPQMNDQGIAVANTAIKGGYTLPCVSLGGYAGTITGLIADDPTQSRFYAPFAKRKPDNISDADWQALQADARAAITDSVYPALRKHAAWFTGTYMPKCAKAPGVSAQPNGAAYYAFRIRQQTTTTKTADEIHQIGLAEVKRIGAEMDSLAAKAGFPSRAAFVQELRTNPKYYAKTPEELMEKVARFNKKVDGMMPGLFATLPRLPYGIREVPAETAEGTTTAYYQPGSPQNGIAGTFYVNTSKLDQRPLWEIPALALHEAVPGHHNQIARQQELSFPEWRKNDAQFTAFIEGWGLYAEHLGIELGVYDTPEKDMGRLSYEMWRACRLVVDTGIHAKGWTKQQAIDFMTANTALSAANIEAEVNRYIAWPGQALAYKLGELKIRELRARAEAKLGDTFDVRRFHDAVLGQGPVPLDVLDQQIEDWIASEAGKK